MSANKSEKKREKNGFETTDSLIRINCMLDIISRAQMRCIAHASVKDIFGDLLQDLITISDSKFGFIGEVFYTAEGSPYLKLHVVSDIAWNEETKALYAKCEADGMEFHNLKNLIGQTLVGGQVYISNDPAGDLRRGGLPPGHPSVKSYLGIPIRHGGTLVGMAGVANRPGGYDESLVSYLTPFINTCGAIIESCRIDRRRQEAESDARAKGSAYQGLYNAVGCGVVIEDAQGDIVDINEEACALVGLTRMDVMSSASRKPPVNFVYEDGTSMPPDDRPGIRAIRDGRPVRNMLIGIYRGKKSDVRWLLVNAEPIAETPGAPFLTAITTFLDVTGRKKAIDEIQLMKTRYEELFRNMTSAVAVYRAEKNGEDFFIVDFNPAAERIENVRREEIVDRSVLDVFPGVRDFGLFDVFQRVWRTGVSEHHPIALYKDRRVEGWRDNFVYKLPCGLVVAIYDDVTQKKQAEEKLREAARFLDEDPSPVLRLARDGRVLYANPAATPVLASWKCGVGDRVPDEWRETVSSALIDMSKHVSDVACADRIFSFIVVPIQRGEYVNLYGRDVTESRRTWQELRDANRVFQKLMEVSPSGLFRADVRGDYTFVNESWCAMANVEPGEAMGAGWVRAVHPEDRDRVVRLWEQTVKEGWPFEADFRFCDSDGEAFRVRSRAVADKDDSGAVVGYLGAVTAITEKEAG